MDEHDSVACMEMDINALRLLHRVVSDAYEQWPGGLQEEQQCLRIVTKNARYGKGHPSKVAVGVSHENCGREPVVVEQA